MQEIKQSVYDMMKARDLRQETQEYMLKKYKSTLISFKLNIPGEIKDSELYRKIFKEGETLLLDSLENENIKLIYKYRVYNSSGPEGFFVIDSDAKKIKNITSYIEDSKTLGRIFDLDVIDKNFRQIKREDIKKEPRKCFLCSKNAFECARARRHSVEQMLSYINKVAVDYFNCKKEE